jgi:peptide/nickel transport system substrate-binding protein
MRRRSAIAASIALASCGVSRRRFSGLVLGYSHDPGVIDPARLAAQDWTPLGLIHETLIRCDHDNSLRPGLAESWRWLDERSLELQLRPHQKFSDGSPMDAAAARASIERAAAARWSLLGLPALSVERSGTLGLVLRTARPFQPLPDYLAYLHFAITKPANGAWLGTGPYRWDGYRPHEYARLMPNPHHPGTSPEVTPAPPVLMRYLPDAQSRWLALRSGEIHAMRSPPLPEVQLRPLPDGVRGYRGHGRHVHYIGVNQSYGRWAKELSNPLIRRALRLAVDNAAIVRTVLHGAGQPAGSVLSPWFQQPLHSPAVPRHVGKAESLFAECGWRKSSSGQLTRRGETFRLTYAYSPSWMPFTQALAELIQSQLADAGVSLDLVPMEWAAASEAERRGLVQLRHRGLPFAVGGAHYLFRNGFHSASSHLASIHCRDSRVDRLLQDWESGSVQPRDCAVQLETLIGASAAFWPLFFEREIVAVGPQVREAGGLAAIHPFLYPLNPSGVQLHA